MGPPGTSRRREGCGSHSRKSKKQEGICCKLSLNNLWSIWYCSLAVALQLYIVATSIIRFGQYIALPWPIHDQPYLELNAYIGFLGASVVIMPFFVATAILRIGNYPNDGQDVCLTPTASKGDYAVYQNIENIQAERKKGHWVKTIWRHGGPTSAFLHVASAFCLLLPKVFIQPQLIRHGFLKKSELWSSELDFLVTHKERLVTLSFLSTINVSELLAHDEERFPSAPLELPVKVEESTPYISAEFINYGVSLLVYSIQYPSVLWNSSKSFSFLFSIQLFLNGLLQLISFTGFGILYKVHICGPAATLARFSPFMLSLSTTILLFFLYNIVMTITSSAMYAYALQKHREWIDRQLKRHHILWAKERWRLWGYTSHVSAFIVLVVLACAATPIAYDLTIVYCGSLDGMVLASIASMVTHLFLWILLWLFLTVKQRWVFAGRKNRECKKRLKSCSDPRALTCNGHIPGVDTDLSQLRSHRGDTPLLVIDNGHTFQIRDSSCRKMILNLASQSLARQTNSSSTDEEDIYWLKPKTSPKAREEGETAEEERLWMKNSKKSISGGKSHKVTFDEARLNSSAVKKKPSKYQATAKSRKSPLKIEDFGETASEEGDYATLTNVKVMENLDSGHGYRTVCPLGKKEMARTQRTGRLEASAMQCVDPGCESIKSTDSIIQTFPATGLVNSPPLDRLSPSSNSPEKIVHYSCSLSGIHSSTLPSPPNGSASGSAENVSALRNSSMAKRSIPTSPDSTHEALGPTIRILRNPEALEKDKLLTRESQVKFTTFSENTGCITKNKNPKVPT